MEETELLKEYYYDHVDPDRVRDFDELSTDEKEMIRDMWGFAFFKANKALSDAKKKVSDLLPHN
jgi:hypothetical protein